MAPLPPLDFALLDAAFASMLHATLQASVVIVVVALARTLLGPRLSPGAQYALWALLALPFVAPLLPTVVLPVPTFAPLESAGAPPRPTPQPPKPAGAGGPAWRVVYEPLVAPVSSPVVSTTPTNRLRLAGLAWLTGATVLVLRVVITHARAVRHARRAQPITDPAALHLLDQCRRTVGARRTPRLVAAPANSGPALLGFLRPHLLLPADASRRLSPDELRFVFLHELVHLRRADPLGEWLLTLLQVLHWFNPLVWLAARRCRADREIACDAAVVALAGEAGRADYGRTILRLATELAADLAPGRFSPRPFPSPALGILQSRSPLERRLRMIAAAPNARASRWPVVFVALFALALVACTNQGSPDGKAPPKSAAADVGSSNAAQPKTPGPRSEARTQTRPDARPTPDVLEVPPEWPDITASRDRTVAEEKRNDPKNAAVRAKLELVLPEVNFDAVPFTDAVDYFRDVSGANLFINWRALENAGVDRKAPVTARLRDVRFSKALSVVLESLGGGTIPLGYTVDDGVITVSTGEDLGRDTITRVYDVRDLLITIPDYEPPPPLDLRVEPAVKPQPDAPAANERAKIEAEHADMRTRQETVEELARLITETIAPESWRDAGGTLGSVRELQGQFIITQTPDNHLRILALLEQFRQARAVQIGLEAKFVSVDDAVLAALPAALRATVEGELRAARDPVPVDPDAGPELPPAAPAGAAAKEESKLALLTPQQVEQLLRAAQASKRAAIITAPRITLFNGQSAYVLIANQRAYTADYVTIKENDGSTRFEPQIGTASSGVVWSVRATASADRKFATVSMRPRLSILESIDEVPWDRSPPDLKLTVQRPRILASELATTATIPDGQTLLLGGLKAHVTEEGKFRAEGAGAGGAWRRAEETAVPIILLVQPKLIIQREIETRQFPLLSEPVTQPAP